MGTKCIKLLCSKASNFMFSPPISMLFPVFGAHLRKIEFLYSMQTWKELCDKLAISWLKLAKTWANWRLSCHMQRFQQAIRRGIPFPQTLSSFPSNVLILSLKRPPTFRLCRYSVGNYRTSPLAYCPPGRCLCVWVYPGTSPLRSDVHRLLMVVP